LGVRLRDLREQLTASQESIPWLTSSALPAVL